MLNRNRIYSSSLILSVYVVILKCPTLCLHLGLTIGRCSVYQWLSICPDTGANVSNKLE